jgi:uncharacterized membrane protein
MVAMREVNFEGDGQVPGIAIAVSYLLVLSSIVMLVIYVHHIGRSLRVSALIELVGDDTRALLDEQYPELLEPAITNPSVIVAPRSGVLTSIDRDRLVALATAGGCVLRVVPAVGSFVPSGGTLIHVDGDTTRLDRQAATDALRSGLERTLDEDVAYGFRMLVDMAERALSDSPFLDPTTAVQAIDRLHDGLRQLAGRSFPDGRFFDASGHLRLTVPAMDWDAYVHLAFDEIRLAGGRSPQVSRRLIAALEDLLEVAPPERRGVLLAELELLGQDVRAASLQPLDVKIALTPDPQGLGVAAGDGYEAAQGDGRPISGRSRP